MSPYLAYVACRDMMAGFGWSEEQLQEGFYSLNQSIYFYLSPPFSCAFCSSTMSFLLFFISFFICPSRLMSFPFLCRSPVFLLHCVLVHLSPRLLPQCAYQGKFHCFPGAIQSQHQHTAYSIVGNPDYVRDNGYLCTFYGGYCMRGMNANRAEARLRYSSTTISKMKVTAFFEILICKGLHIVNNHLQCRVVIVND